MAPPNDPQFSQQWWFSTPTGTGIQKVWEDYRGLGVTVGLVDTGFDYNNPEYAGRVDTTRDYDARDRDTDASSAIDAGSVGEASHGAGVIAVLGASMNNRIGGAGVAPETTLVGFRMAPRSIRTSEQETMLLERQSSVDVSLNAWSYSGEFFRDDFSDVFFSAAGRATAAAAAQGRGGLGTIIVRSAGNARAEGDDVGAHSYQNNRYSITVGAVNAGGTVQPSSNPGASLLVTAPSDFTSNAAAIVAGTAALILQANSSLGWRDVQDILAASARPTNTGSGSWVTNGAGTWNGGGMMFSRDYGFGVVDARAAVRLAEGWTDVSTSANERVLTGSAAPGAAIPDNNGNGTSSQVQISGGIEVDRAEVVLDIDHARVGDLRVFLTSPSGTRIALYDRLGKGGAQGSLEFTTTANAFRGEQGQGTWTLTVVDAAGGATGVLSGWTLRVTGDTPDSDTRHIYTDAFGSIGTGARAQLSDPGGTDTLDASAVSGTVQIDLRAGTSSIIAGRSVAIAAGTTIEHARGGDGNDILAGNEVGNLLAGNRGDDLLLGAGGNDTLVGGDGADRVLLSGTRGQYSFTRLTDGSVRVTGPDGTDILREIETVTFANNTTMSLNEALGATGPATEGNDSLEGGTGRDTIDGLGGNDSIFGLDGADDLSGGAGDDFLNGGRGADTLRGGDGNDTLFGDADYDLLDGGNGDDTVDFGHRAVAVVDLSKGTAKFPTATVQGTELLANVEHVLGSSGTDTIIGAANNNMLDGREGDDMLQGLGGNDTITGGAGTDTALFAGNRA
ncbi:MAG TPA: S8 family serine peptidase, partial [Azospirillaceae bacterium]|nr:S8 family serine peptidase [Azospirillaceae bacterium]